MFEFITKMFKPKTNLHQLVLDGAVIIDVRSKEEFQAGHIEGSRNVPLDKIKKEITSLRNLKKPLIIVCHSGYRSQMAKSILASAGFEVFNGGAWTNLKRQLQ